ncbi:MAG: PrsW family glutamic-type intramembrane protease, partial [Marmoricola sp.]
APEGFGTDQIGNSLHTIVLRLATGFTSHIAYASIFGAGIIYIVGTRWQPRRVGLGLALCALSMLLHATWDSAGVLSNGNAAVLYVLLLGFIVIAVVAILSVFHLTVGGERAALREAMRPEVDNGTLTAEELDALSGNRKARRAYRRHGKGHRAKRQRAHRLDAAHDLASELDHSGGRDTERVSYARAELARLEVTGQGSGPSGLS